MTAEVTCLLTERDPISELLQNFPMMKISKPLIGAIDQGTSSTRFLIFTAQTGELVTYHQKEISRFSPKEGYVEQDPNEIFESVLLTMKTAIKNLRNFGYRPEDIKAIGLSNQRESTIVWDKETGEPLYNCLVWMDNRTKDLVEEILDQIPDRNINYLKKKTGLPISNYFSAFKLKWLIQNVAEVRKAIKEDRLLFGTVDSWLLWKFTGKHLTDVTNASRTLLMDIETLQWNPMLCKFFDIPTNILPEIRSSADFFGEINLTCLNGIPITGVIGDQQSALIGQKCFEVGQVKATFGTGCFLMQNIGSGHLQELQNDLSKEAQHNLLTTVAYKFGSQPACYALEGSIAIAGAAITWLRDNLELIQSYDQVEPLASEDTNSGGVFFVPAFQGLYAPYWDPNATGTIFGLTQFTRKCHLIRATLEGVVYQTNDILSMMCQQQYNSIKIDGGMSNNDLMCQILADISSWDVIRPKVTETTALGAAMVAGYAVGLWDINNSPVTLNGCISSSGAVISSGHLPNAAPIFNFSKLRMRRFSYTSPNPLSNERCFDIFTTEYSDECREQKIKTWNSAVSRCRNWIRNDK